MSKKISRILFRKKIKFFLIFLLQKSVSYDDEILIDLLAATSICYSSKWLITKSETFSILAIQIAR